jgi:hypothetical protein
MQTWARFLLILLMVAVGIILAFNAATYNKIANNGETIGDVTPGGARTLMWFNVILCVIVFVAVIWYTYAYFRATEKVMKFEQTAKEYYNKAQAVLVAEDLVNARRVAQTPRRRLMPGYAVSSPEIEMSMMSSM